MNWKARPRWVFGGFKLKLPLFDLLCICCHTNLQRTETSGVWALWSLPALIQHGYFPATITTLSCSRYNCLIHSQTVGMRCFKLRRNRILEQIVPQSAPLAFTRFISSAANNGVAVVKRSQTFSSVLAAWSLAQLLSASLYFCRYERRNEQTVATVSNRTVLQ